MRAERFALMARLAELPGDLRFFTQITMEAGEELAGRSRATIDLVGALDRPHVPKAVSWKTDAESLDARRAARQTYTPLTFYREVP